MRPIAARLDELRLAALERRIDADIDCGRARRGGGGARSAGRRASAARAPARRCRCWRSTAAAARPTRSPPSARRARRSSSELGLEPSAELQELERAILRQDPALAPAGRRAAPRRAPRRCSSAALDAGSLAGARRARRAARAAPRRRARAGRDGDRARTARAGDGRAARARRRARRRGVIARVAAFTSVTPGTDLARLATEQDADLLLVDAPAGLLEDARADRRCSSTRRATSPSSSASRARAPGRCWCRSPAPSTTGRRSSWAPGWRSRSTRPLRLAGASTGAAGRDASRLLASASLALQRALGVHAEPLIVEPVARRARRRRARAPASSSSASPSAGGARGSAARAPRSRRSAGAPTLLVRRGLRPGGLAARSGRHALHLDDRGRGRLISAPRAAAARAGSRPARSLGHRRRREQPADRLVDAGDAAQRGRAAARPPPAIRTSRVETTACRLRVERRPRRRAGRRAGARARRAGAPRSPPACSSAAQHRLDRVAVAAD